MEVIDDIVGSVVNAGFDLHKENLNGMFTNTTLLTLLMLSLNKDKPFPKTSNTFETEYDYIIVGAGPAGCVMANRLTENKCVTVLLLEAGGYAPLLTEIPSMARMLYNTSIDWHYMTTPQTKGAFGQNENRVPWLSGKGLGGGSIINSMLYVRGNKQNYNDWETEGCTGWGYKDVLPYFKKYEDNQNLNDPEMNSEYHGGGEPVTVEKPKYEPEIKKAIMNATKILGYDVTDSNGERQTGIYDIQAMTRNGQRCSSAKAYLVPAENRPNLTILKRAYVTKIVMNGTSADGVEFDFKGVHSIVRARKEVIISAGTVRTAQILMLAGIGPKDHLEKFHIPVIANLPVGKNLQDHYATNLNYVLSPLIQNVIVKNINPVNVLKYLTSRSGPMASPSQVTLLAFLDGLNTTSKSPDSPRQELFFAEYSPIDAMKNYNLKSEYYAGYYGPYTLDQRAMYTCIVSLLQPYSRGEILLNSTDPNDLPLINPNYYQDIRDLKDTIKGMKICEAVSNSPALKEIGTEPYKTTYPGCEEYKGNDDKLFGCMAQSVITSFWHPVGTARMGQPGDPRSVVDTQLSVIGVKNLRVINAAVMPIIPSGNTFAATTMVAEKAYAMMKAGIKCSKRKQKPKRKNH